MVVEDGLYLLPRCAGGAAPSIPDIKWDDVGGLEDVKATLLDTIELPLKCEMCSGLVHSN